MKRFFAVLMITFCMSCSNSNEADTGNDSSGVKTINPGTDQNDMPMRTTDTDMNIMKDTMTMKPK